MFDSVYRKIENYYPKVLLEKYCFTEDIKVFCINSDEEYYDEECINLFLKALELESLLLKYKKDMRLQISISGNIRNFLILKLEISIS